MTIRAKLYTAIVVAVAGLVLTGGAGVWGMNQLGDRFDAARKADDARALALQLKYGVTDFNGWQTAYGYDDGKSRAIFLRSVAAFQATLARARVQLRSRPEQRLLEEISDAFNDFMRLDDRAFAALRAGRTGEVKRIFLGPELAIFERGAAAAQRLAELERANASAQEHKFERARTDALRRLLLAALVAAVLVGILLATAVDLARRAEQTLEESRPEP
ncbi:MAG: hypothetical protein M3R70_13580 [Actinomycetota bacterium]|nr:hypothetical protein [Actinomycetota bacterium]